MNYILKFFPWSKKRILSHWFATPGKIKWLFINRRGGKWTQSWFSWWNTRVENGKVFFYQLTFDINCFRRHIEVHGRPTPAVFRNKPHQGGKNSFRLIWTVDSYSRIEEYRLLYRQIKPFHPVSPNQKLNSPIYGKCQIHQVGHWACNEYRL